MPVQDTSLAAYADLRSTLSQRERAVWHALGTFQQPPTAYELLKAMQRDYPSIDLNGVRPRLTALLEKRCVETCGKRPCAVTGKTVLTWRAIAGRPPMKPQPKPQEMYDANAPREGSLF